MLEDVLAQQGRQVVGGYGVGPDSDFGAVPVDPTVFCVSEREDRRSRYMTVVPPTPRSVAGWERDSYGTFSMPASAPRMHVTCAPVSTRMSMCPSVTSLGNVTWVLIIGLRLL